MVSLSCAFIPPPEVVEDLRNVVRDVAYELPGFGFEPVTDERLLLRVTNFGNLTTPDTRRLLATLTAALAVVERPPKVRFSGVIVDSDGTVRLGMAGDVEDLHEIARFVPVVAEGQRLYVDRRKFWPGLVIGQVPVGNSDAVRGACEVFRDWESADWVVSAVSLLRLSGGMPNPYAEVGMAGVA